MATITSLKFDISSDWDGSGVREARGDLKLLNEDLRRVNNLRIRVVVDVDDSQARQALRRLDNDTRNRALALNVDVDTERAERQLARLARNRTVNIDVDTRSLQAGVTSAIGVVGGLGSAVAGVGQGFGTAASQAVSMGSSASAAGGLASTGMSAVGTALAAVVAGMAAATVAAGVLGAAGAASGALVAGGVALVPIALAAWPLAFESVRVKVGPVFDGLKAQVEGFANGITDQLMPAWQAFAGSLTEAFEKLKPALNVITPLLDTMIRQIGDKLVPLADVFGETMVRGFGLGSEALSAFMDGLRPIAAGISDFFDAFSEDMYLTVRFIPQMMEQLGRLIGIMGKVIDSLLPIGVTFMDVFTDIAEALAPVIDSIARELEPLLATLGVFLVDALRELGPPFSQLLGQFGRMAQVLMENLRPALAPLAAAWSKIFDAIEPMIPVFGEFIAAWVEIAAQVLPVIADVATSLLQTLTPALKPIAEVVRQLAPQFGELARQLGIALVDALNKIAPHLPALVKAFGDLLLAVIPLLPKMMEFVTVVLPPLIDKFIALSPWILKIVDGFTKLVNGAITVVTWMGNITIEVGKMLQGSKEALDKAKLAWEVTWTAIKSAVEVIWQKIQAAWDTLLRVVREVWDSFKTKLSEAWDTFWNTIKAAAQRIWDTIRDAWNAFTGKIREVYDSFATTLREKWDGFWDKIRSVASGIWDTITEKWDAFTGFMQESFEKAKTKIGEIWNGIKAVFAKPINFIIRVWNEHVAGKFDLDKFDEIKDDTGNAYATGGPVFGAGTSTSDSIPARLSDGEHVWTAAEVRGAGGHGAIASLRAEALAGNNYAAGGPVEWMIGQQQRSAPALHVTSSYRNTDSGYHSRGQAVDFSNGGIEGSPEMMAFANWIADKWGERTHQLIHSPFGRNIAPVGRNVGDGMGYYGAGEMAGHRDHVHWAVDRALNDDEGGSVAGGGSGGIMGRIRETLGALFARLTQPLLNAIPDPALGLGGGLGKLPKNAATKIRDGLRNIIDGSDDGSYGGAGPAAGGEIPGGEQLRLIDDALRRTNTPPPNSTEAWQRGLNTLITRESAWNPGAVNNWDSNQSLGGTHGLMQLLHSNFQTYHQPGTSDNIYDSLANIAAGINYIKDRHGDISNVQQANANLPPKGYMAGTNNAAAGWHMVGESGPEMVRFRGGEQVKTFNDIVTELKSASTAAGNQMATKLVNELKVSVERLGQQNIQTTEQLQTAFAAEVKTLVDKMIAEGQATGQKLALSMEDMLERLLAGLGINIPINIQGGGDAQAMVEQLKAQLFPQLEMMLKQRVGINA